MTSGTKRLSSEMRKIALAESQLAGVPTPTESGVFVTAQRSIDEERPSLVDLAALHAVEEVTLVVYGWENVQPGTLSWVFPSLRAALDAVRAMRNAVRWVVLLGNDEADVDAARESGRVLVEA